MEKINALTDIPLLVTLRGRLSVRDALLDAHILKGSSDKEMGREPVVLDKSVPGYVYGAELRLLAAVVAVVLRQSNHAHWDPFRIDWERILSEGLEPEAIDEAIEILAPGSLLFDDRQPFMQRPAEPMRNAKDNERKLGKGELRLKKLLPSMISDQGEEFWSLLTQRDTLSLEDAALYLLAYHCYSPAGNNSYAGQKAEMGSPGFHFVGVGMTATELIWEGSSLLHTLLAMIPRSWVEGDGLPAWADRTGSRGGTDHPLWRATWSSNSAACYWEDNELAGVRIGGVPPAWVPPEAGATKESRKAYWVERDQSDPFYLYLPNKSGELKAQRMDVGRDATDLAVEWAARGRLAQVAEAHDRIVSSSDCRLIFIRHYIEGTASSPVIRSSRVDVADPQLWAFGLSDRAQGQVRRHAEFIQALHYCVIQPFRRARGAASVASNGMPTVLDSLENYRDSASDIFWRAITRSYEDFLSQVTTAERHPEEIRAARGGAAQVALGAFNEAIAPYRGQDPALFAAVYSNVARHIRAVTKQFDVPTAYEEK